MKQENLTVYVLRRPNMFIVNEMLTNQIGLGELKKIMHIEDYEPRKDQDLYLYFPERFLNIIEQRALMIRLEKIKQYKTITIVTQSVYIMQCTNRENLFIIQDESLSIDELGKGKLSLDNIPNIMPDSCNVSQLYT